MRNVNKRLNVVRLNWQSDYPLSKLSNTKVQDFNLNVKQQQRAPFSWFNPEKVVHKNTEICSTTYLSACIYSFAFNGSIWVCFFSLQEESRIAPIIANHHLSHQTALSSLARHKRRETVQSPFLLPLRYLLIRKQHVNFSHSRFNRNLKSFFFLKWNRESYLLSASRPDLQTMPFFLGLVSNNQLDAVR